jgi:hypothetical protein
MDSHASSCEWCRGTIQAADRLRSKRLGKHERHQLLHAASPEEDPRPILPLGTSHSAQTATRRAVAQLVNYGLIQVSSDQLRLVREEDAETLRMLDRQYAVLRLCRRTQLGQEVVNCYHEELREGKRIRWLLQLNDALEAALGACPSRST